jgi:3-methyladenine DNA glycosylase AlkC
MADDLKSFFGQRVVEGLAQDFARAHPRFDSSRFVAESLEGLESLELLARAWQIAEAMRRHLPEKFPSAARVLLRSLGPELNVTELAGMEVFRYLPHVFYVSKYGLDFFDDAMRVQYELTKRFSAEFSIRAYLVKYPDQTYARLCEWARDSNVHVRRLVSEGTRPRLPWAPRLRAFQQDPSPVLALLEQLKDDPELYVRRSVANSLNDIGRDHPDVTVETCRRWLKGSTREREWVVNHALRSLVKKGHPEALKLLGVGAVAKIRVKAVCFTTRTVRIGGELEFSFDLVSVGRSRQSLMVDYAVHFVKANGSTSPKVFKLKRLDLSPGESATLSGRVSFREMTTRKHHPGLHRFDALINGKAFPLGVVRLLR